MKACFQSANFLLPIEDINIKKWSVVACDQFTSQPSYWHDVENIIDSSPSTLNIVYPEAFLSQGDSRIERINNTMNNYLSNGTLTTRVNNGYILIERDTISGKRLGLVGVLDLDEYDYNFDSTSLVRATEGTIQDRITPRVKIRRNASLECSHVMVLINDFKRILIEDLYKHKHEFDVLYDTELMQGGGHIIGYRIDGEKASEIDKLLLKMQENSNGLFLLVGDGNHSLATAKTCWEEIKHTLPLDLQPSHPAKYATVELVNLHSDALFFEPIHRIMFSIDDDDFINCFYTYCKENSIDIIAGDDIEFITIDKSTKIGLSNSSGRIPVEIMQQFIDAYILQHVHIILDYIHGNDTLRSLVDTPNTLGILLKPIQKNGFFEAVRDNGVLPRKTFSMGNSEEKRYYMECRKITSK